MRVDGQIVRLNQLEACALLIPNWEEAPSLVAPDDLPEDAFLEWLNSDSSESVIQFGVSEVNLFIASAREMRRGYETVMDDMSRETSSSDLLPMRLHNNHMIQVIDNFSKGIHDRLSTE